MKKLILLVFMVAAFTTVTKATGGDRYWPGIFVGTPEEVDEGTICCSIANSVCFFEKGGSSPKLEIYNGTSTITVTGAYISSYTIPSGGIYYAYIAFY